MCRQKVGPFRICLISYIYSLLNKILNICLSFILKRASKMNLWKFIAGLTGVIGVIVQTPKDAGSWMVGLAFLILMISSFFNNS